MKRTLFILLAATTAMIGCKRDPAGQTASTEQLVIAADIFGATRASFSQSAFAAGESASVWITASRATAVQPLLASGNFADNVQYTYDDATSTFVNHEDEITFPDPDSKLGLYSLYPYNASVALADDAGVISYVHTVLADQTIANDFVKSDLLTATRATKGVSVADMATPAPMTYFHRMAKFDITVVAPLKYGDDEFVDIVSVKLLGFKAVSRVVLSDPNKSDDAVDYDPNTAIPAESFGATTVDIAMNMAQKDADDATTQTQTRVYEAIVIPQSMTPGARVIEVTASYGGNTIVFPYIIADQAISLVAGKSNALALNLLKPYPIAAGNVTLVPWTTESFDGDMDYVRVDNQFVTQANTLSAGYTSAKVKLKDDTKVYTVQVKYNADDKQYSFAFDGTNNTEPADYPYTIENIDFYTDAAKTATYPCSQAMADRDAASAQPTLIALKSDLDNTTQPANCYITYPGKTMLFDARKKAASISGAATNIVASDVPSADINPETVSVVWQTAANHGNAITSPVATDMIIQGITFDKATGICTVLPHATGSGNALVAAYAADGTTILWSWHIWVTSGVVQGNVSPGNEANGAGKNFMDRNLGALAATATQPTAANAYKYFGLLWQWGRKEPFTGQGLGEKVNTYTKIYKADATEIPAGTLGGFTYNNGAAPTMLPCIQNPTTHYYGGNDGNVISGNPNTWSDTPTAKSIYDPCPYGYRVPIDGSWTGFPSKTWTLGTINEGQQWQSTWWPATGYRINNSAAVNNVANGAYYWSSSPHTSVAYYSYSLYFSGSGTVNPSNNNSRSGGFSLRCVQE